MNSRLMACTALVLACQFAASSPVRAFIVTDAEGQRWSNTSFGSTGARGDPITISWSIVPDGTLIPAEGTTSNLQSFLDNTIGGAWPSIFEDSFDRWGELSGITFIHEQNDNNPNATLGLSSGIQNVRGDIRIGGTTIDGASGTLAYAYSPDIGDIVIDTSDTAFFGNSTNTYRALRNTLMHEIGHAFGLLHVESNTNNFLMEPSINTSFDGPQLDDIRGVQYFYGDAFEKTNGGLGNDTVARSTSLGAIAQGGEASVGTDAGPGQFVAPTDIDFVSIDGTSDTDFFSFTVSEGSQLDVVLTPLGGVFNQGEQGGEQITFDASARSDLELTLFGTNGSPLLPTVNETVAGQVETLLGVSLPGAGQYYVSVTGADDTIQPYELELSVAAVAPVLIGDYNNDGVVDAADYTVWRDSAGTSNSLMNDLIGGVVGEAQYVQWRDNFGKTSGGGSATTASVPEPASALLWILAVLGGWPLALRRRRAAGFWEGGCLSCCYILCGTIST